MTKFSVYCSSAEYTIVVTGCTGRGKSTFCNFLSRSNKFKPDIPGNGVGLGKSGKWGEVAADVTGSQCHVVEVGGVTFHIIDLPGYLATQNQTGNDREDLAKDGKMVLDEFAKAMINAKDGIDAIFVTLRAADRCTREEELLMEFISLLQLWDHCILLFTHGDRVGKEENQRYQDFHELIKSPDFADRIPVLHKMLQYVNSRFVIVESVNSRGDQEYYLSKVDELCKAVEVVRERTGAMISHPLVKLAKNAFEVSQRTLDLRDELDQEREGRCNIQTQLEHAQREQEERDEAYKSLQAELERERAEIAAINHKLQEEKNKQTQFIKQRQDLCHALQQQQQRQLPHKSNADQDAAVNVLIHWLEEPQTGPDEVAAMIADLSALADNHRRPPHTVTARAEFSVQNQDRTRVDDSFASSTVPKEVPLPGGEPVRAQKDDRGVGPQRRSRKCLLF